MGLPGVPLPGGEGLLYSEVQGTGRASLWGPRGRIRLDRPGFKAGGNSLAGLLLSP